MEQCLEFAADLRVGGVELFDRGVDGHGYALFFSLVPAACAPGERGGRRSRPMPEARASGWCHTWSLLPDRSEERRVGHEGVQSVSVSVVAVSIKKKDDLLRAQVYNTILQPSRRKPYTTII